MRGYWWAPDGSALLVARVDESPVQRWYIADPGQSGPPGRAGPLPGGGHAQRRCLPAAGQPGRGPDPADGRLTEVSWDRAAFPYLVTVCWDGAAPRAPLIVVQSRDQREMRLLAVDLATGATSLVRADTDPYWLEIVPGVPGQDLRRPDRVDHRLRRGQAAARRDRR